MKLGTSCAGTTPRSSTLAEMPDTVDATAGSVSGVDISSSRGRYRGGLQK